jgi:uncharacterized protein YjbJ (UPF0337 family)
MRIPRVELANGRGLFDKLIGLGKETLGEALGSDDLIDAGEAQQAKGTERLKAIRKQAKADAHEAKARVHEVRERAAQRSKAG